MNLTMNLRQLIIALTLLTPPVSAQVTEDLKLIGEGEMKWLFWNIYQARLYSADGTYPPAQGPIALSIRYQREITAAELIRATEEQWQHLKLDYPNDWPERLEKIWPSVKDGDSLTLRIEHSGKSNFYLNQKAIGSINDPNFGPTFLAIWMSPDTSRPELRAKLLGQP